MEFHFQSNYVVLLKQFNKIQQILEKTFVYQEYLKTDWVLFLNIIRLKTFLIEVTTSNDTNLDLKL